MKKRIIVITGLLMFLSGSFLGCARDGDQELSQENDLTISCTPELYDLTRGWADIYGTVHPDVNIEVVKVAADEGSINGQGERLLLVSDRAAASGLEQSPWKEVIGREVIVPVINANNPFLEEIRQQGISAEQFARIFGNKGASWGELLGTRSDAEVDPYLVDDPSILAGMEAFLRMEGTDIGGTRVKSGEELIAAVQGDPYAIGVCRIAHIAPVAMTEPDLAISMLPIDRNGNGRLDYKEDIYASMALFTRGVWIGKYPRELVHNVYSVFSNPPDDQKETAFLKWVLTDGQPLLDNYGFTGLERSESVAKVRLIDRFGIAEPASVEYPIPAEPFYTRIYLLAMLVLFAIILTLTISGFIVRERGQEGSSLPLIPDPVFTEKTIESPQGLYYDRTHTWAFMNASGHVLIGIDDFLQRVTGPLTNIKMKKPGERIRKGKKVLSIIQEGKQLDICAPLSGTIVEMNEALWGNTTLINTSPYAEGWIYKIEPSNWIKDIQSFFMVGSYKEWLKTEILRLKDFVSESLRPEAVAYSHVLQDGGELKENVLREMGPEVWEDFQTNFIDVPS